MDHLKILSRAWKIVWNQKALWLFAFLFALAGGTGAPSGGGNIGYSFSGEDIPPQWGGTGPSLPDINWGLVLLVVVIAVVVIILVSVLLALVRYVAETAIIAGVDEVESTGDKLTVRRGFRLGWSKRALRLFLVDLVIGLPVAMVFLGLLVLAASPLLLWLVQDMPEAIHVLATIISVGLLLLVILFGIAVALILSLVMPYIRRQTVLGGQGVLASIRQGVRLVRHSLLDTGLMWLLLVAVGIVWGLVLIPVMVMLTLVGVLIGGVPALLVYMVSQSIIAAAIVGVPLFLLVFIPPLLFLQGMFELYTSSAWTLAYREVTSRSMALSATA